MLGSFGFREAGKDAVSTPTTPASNIRKSDSSPNNTPFARSTSKVAVLRVLDLSLGTSTATGRTMLTMLGAIAQFEREMTLERQREGIAKAKAAGKYRGRAPTARAKASQVQALQAKGIRQSEIARRLGIGRSSVYPLLNSAA